ncbi:mitochondrial ribosomal protein subunit S2 [Panaeolus papilionaceus]|nr:mitochondrial ribosomal protein subunit S2 [Panaeolus papilionaceus]
MSQSTIRPLLNIASINSRSSFKYSSIIKRAHSTQQHKKLETPEDWQQFREKRAQVSQLSNIFEQYGSTQTSESTFRPSDGLRKPPSHATVSALLAAGAHFGHAATRMNPNFVPYAYGTRSGITIIDLDQTLPMLRRATNLTRSVARAGGIIVFIGTRPDLRPIVLKAAERVGPQGFHVGERWLPGTLSNRRQFFGEETADNTRMTPDLAIILNPLQNMIAINECAAENIPTIGIIDSNVDPRVVMYPIPANDENTRTAELVAGVLSIAAREGAILGTYDRQVQQTQDSKRDRVKRHLSQKRFEAARAEQHIE